MEMVSDKASIDRIVPTKEKVKEILIDPVVLASAINERLHEIKPTGRKVKIRKSKKS
jgi:hypothetical protein